MGVSTDAVLAYGFHLGGDDSGWKVTGVNEYGEAEAHEDLSEYITERLEGTGCELVMFQHCDVPQYFLAVWHHIAARGEVFQLPMKLLMGSHPKWHELLRDAIAKLDVKPLQIFPKWFMASSSDY